MNPHEMNGYAQQPAPVPPAVPPMPVYAPQPMYPAAHFAPVGMPVYGMPPMPETEAAKQNRLKKAMRQDASRLSLAVLLAQPIGIVLMIAVELIILLTHSEMMLFSENTINGLHPTLFYLLNAFMSFVTIFLPFWIYALVTKRRLTETVLVEKVGFGKGFLLAFAAVFLCILMNLPANLIAELMKDAGLNAQINTETFTASSVWDVLAMLLSVVLVAPVVEEYAFRGVIVTVLRRWGDWPAVIFSAVTFGIAHFSFQSLPVVLAGGFVMALLYVRTRNIWLNIFVHFLNNLFATLPIVVSFFLGSEVSSWVDLALFLFVAVAGIASIVILLVRKHKGHPIFAKPMEKGEALPKKTLQLFLNPGFIALFVAFIALSLLTLFLG